MYLNTAEIGPNKPLTLQRITTSATTTPNHTLIKSDFSPQNKIKSCGKLIVLHFHNAKLKHLKEYSKNTIKKK